MSGFEVAGIVLGAFPILYETAKDLNTRYRDLKSWWQFEVEFEDFVSAIDQTFPWHDPQIQVLLRQRLQDRYYVWYMQQLSDINAAISKMLELLPTKKVYQIDSTSLASELFRLKWSFSHKKNELLTIIKDRNEAIYAFLDRAAHVESRIKSTRYASNAWKYLTAQKEASSIYECLQSHWTCNCLSNHSCGIRASTGLQNPKKRNFALVFEEGLRLTEVMVEVTETNSAKSSIEGTQKVSQLRQDVSVKRRYKMARGKSSSLVALAVSSLSIVGNPSGPGEGQSRLQRLAVKLKKSPKLGNSLRDPDEDLAAPDPPRVRFAGDVQPVAQETSDEIRNMCYVARGEVDGPFVGSLSTDLGSRLLFQLEDHRTSPDKAIVVEPLDSFLVATPRMSQRLKVGVQLIQTVLALGVCPWIPETWSKTEVLLIRSLHSTIPTPYVSHQSIRNTLKGKHTVQPSIQARSSLFALGVLLMELLFRTKLESLSIRKQYLGTTPQETQTADLCTAIQWQKSVEGQFGDRIADAIRRCVLCAFEAQPDLSNSAFVKAVCTSVLQPLEEFLSAWTSER
ncbi:hypothetical protein F53441_7816 [Fusarium austroafricanum]|uniref:Uncharacterized protein n=1 Tax=Fusarium austroafricanum TaxID=2364996 RepID=A0A8H4KGQ7_9HYPO|nr:hypothetical protein F53441_7816 [Fusarium austroafricanum]